MAHLIQGHRCLSAQSRTLVAALILWLISPVGTLGAASLQDLDPGVNDGPILQSVKFVGLDTFPDDVVLEALGLEIGKPLQPMQREQRVASLFRDYGLFVQRILPEEVPGGVLLEIMILEFEVDLEPSFIGNASFDEEQIREWAGLIDRSELYLHEADGVVQRIAEGYRRAGFHFVGVSWVASDPLPGKRVRDLVFVIREGPKVRCVNVDIVGNDSLPDAGFLFWKGGLREMSSPKVTGRGPFSWFGSVFVEEEMQADLVAMRQVYRNGGWLDAEVQLEPLQFNDLRNKVEVVIHVDEGPQYMVASVDLVAVEVDQEADGERVERIVPFVFPKADLMAEIELKAGIPFDSARRSHDRSALQRYYGERGYLAAAFFVNPAEADGFRTLPAEVLLDPLRAEVHVTLKLVQGRPRTVRAVEIAGNTNTHDDVVRREISILPGETADLKEIERSLQRIRGLGYFLDRQDPDHKPPTYRFREVSGDPGVIDIEYEVEEGRVVDFQLQGGVASDSGLVGLISLSHSNFDHSALPTGLFAAPGEIYRREAFHGNGESMEINLSPGSRVSFWRFAYRHPDIFSDHFDRWGIAVEALNRDRIYTSHDEDRTHLKLDTTRRFGQGDLSLRFGPVWQRVKLSDLEGGVLPSTLLDSSPDTTFIGVSMRLLWSQLDNRSMPRDGTSAHADLTYFGGPFGGDQDLLKFEGRFEQYFELGESVSEVDPVLVIEAGAGIAAPLGKSEEAHYSERWFLGGTRRLRGFDFRGVGPNEGGIALGGETMAYGSVEVRWPLFSTPIPGTSRKAEMFRGGPFVDFGVLDSNAWDLDMDELRVSYGLSFAMVRPIPISFNLGWPLLEGEGDALQVFSFSLSLR